MVCAAKDSTDLLTSYRIIGLARLCAAALKQVSATATPLRMMPLKMR